VSGKYSLLSDITGDSVPELLVDCPTNGLVKIYAGRRSQRLKEQYGSGNDEPQSGKGWWYRPWAVLWTANKVNDGWSPSGPPLQLYDGNLDGVNDIWLWSSPFILRYLGGDRLDSLIDGIIELPSIGARAWLGDIDGSGIPTIAFYTDILRATVLYKMNRKLPATGVYRQLSHVVSGIGADEEKRTNGWTFTAESNLADREVHILWQGLLQANAEVRVFDILGREVKHWKVDQLAGAIEWSTEGVVGGVYFITLSSNGSEETQRVMVR
jgi:hypothetical protein